MRVLIVWIGIWGCGGIRWVSIWVPELEGDASVVVTYRELYRRVCEFAALLRGFAGVGVGDRVTFQLPMVPELPVAMLACARLGAIHSQVFAGFSGAACGGRMADAQSRVLVTMDGYYRNGVLLNHKVKADQAVARAAEEGVVVEKVLVFRRHPGEYASAAPMVAGRDFFVDEVMGEFAGAVVEPVSMPAEAPLFIMYSSGTTGRPKGCQHSTGGYLSYVAGTSKFYEDIIRRTLIGVSRISVGLRVIRILCMGRWRWGPRVCCMRGCRRIRIRVGRGGSRPGWG